jgi:hypothetical protein
MLKAAYWRHAYVTCTQFIFTADMDSICQAASALPSALLFFRASMGGMVAQELALLLLQQDRLISLGLAVTCRGLKPLGGLLGPLIKPQVRYGCGHCSQFFP